MPIYEFECKKCNSICELLVSINEKPQCKDCGLELNKLFSATHGYVKGTSNPCKN